MTKCPACGAQVVAVVTETQEPDRIGRRRVGPWSFCARCIDRERDLGDERAEAAIREAERSGI